MPSLLEQFFGSNTKTQQLPTMAPYQQQAFQGAIQNPINQTPLYQSGASYLQNILSGNPEAFKAFENPLIQQFQQQIAPGIAERFAGAGTGGSALSSSAFGNSLAQAGRNLSTDLAGLRANLQGNAAQQALGYAQQPYSNTAAFSQISPFAYGIQPPTQGILGGLAQGFGSSLGLASGLGMGPLAGLFGGLGNMFGGGNPQSQRPTQFGQGGTPGLSSLALQ